MDWIDLAKFRDRWLALVNAVMNFQVPGKGRKVYVPFEASRLASGPTETLFHRLEGLLLLVQ
jgi:hypothetical protein